MPDSMLHGRPGVRLFSYKMTNDSGFAPNPFWGLLTLATCKPRIREKKKKDDWIAGFTSTELCGDPVGHERLVYLMQVSRKASIAEYFRDSEFAIKIPSERSLRHRCGDNIYRPRHGKAVTPRDFDQLENDNHYDDIGGCVVGESRAHDVSGRYVLISERFVYFGSKALVIPADVRPRVPKGQSSNGSLTYDEERAQRFIDYVDYVLAIADGKRVVGPPHKWPTDDESWQDGA